MKQLKLVETPSMSAKDNMQYDKNLLDIADTLDSPLLRFYKWNKKSATYGYFICPETFLDMQAIYRYELDIAKRPTGGGIIFHTNDLAFSLIIPQSHFAYSRNTYKNYQTINSIILSVISHYLGKTVSPTFFQNQKQNQNNTPPFCMANSTIYDVVIDEKKVGGAAQRLTHKGLLHQGSICLTPADPTFLKDILQKKPSIIESIQKNSFPLMQSIHSGSKLELKKTIFDFLISHL